MKLERFNTLNEGAIKNLLFDVVDQVVPQIDRKKFDAAKDKTAFVNDEVDRISKTLDAKTAKFAHDFKDGVTSAIIDQMAETVESEKIAEEQRYYNTKTASKAKDEPKKSKPGVQKPKSYLVKGPKGYKVDEKKLDEEQRYYGKKKPDVVTKEAGTTKLKRFTGDFDAQKTDVKTDKKKQAKPGIQKYIKVNNKYVPIDEARKNYDRTGFSKYPYQMYFSDGNMADAVGANTIGELIREVAKKRKLKAFAIFKAGSGFHSTADEEYLVKWYDADDNSYWANRAKKEPEINKKRITSLDEKLQEDLEMNIDLDEFKDFDFDSDTEFLVRIKDSVCKLSKGRGGNWREMFVFGDEPYGFGSKNYQSYLEKDDVMTWLKKDYKDVDVIADLTDLEDAVENIKSSLDESENQFAMLVPSLRTAFSDYLENKNLPDLLDELDAIDGQARKINGGGSKQAGLWWRFFKDDTGANTISSLKRDLELPESAANHKYAIECMELAVESGTEIKIYFS